jgi:hypothetical protein
MSEKKKFTKRIVEWMKGVGEAQDALPSHPREKGGYASTPKGNAHHNIADAHDAEALRIRNATNRTDTDGNDTGWHDYDSRRRVYSSEEKKAWQDGQKARTEGKIADETHAGKMRESAARVKAKGVSGNFADRLRDESRAFYESDAGRVDPAKMSEALKKFKQHGTGLGAGKGMRKVPEGWEWDESVGDIVRKKGTPDKKPDSTIDGRGIGEFIKRHVEDPAGVKGKPKIGDYVTKRKADENSMMEKPFDFKQYTSGEDIQSKLKTIPNKSGLTDMEKGIIIGGGAAATGAGAKEAHSYWTRKKNGQ